MTTSAGSPSTKEQIQWGRWIAMAAGIIFFVVIYFAPDLPDAVDPAGSHVIVQWKHLPLRGRIGP